MNLLSLRYFVEVAEYKNFSKAAKHLYVSQPTLSRHIINLEQELDAVLFLRSKNTLDLTEAGQRLLESAKSILAKCDALSEIAQEPAHDSGGTLNVGYQEYMSTDIMYAGINALSLQNPGIQFSMTRQLPPTLLNNLENGTFDAIFTLRLFMAQLRDVEYKPLRRNQLQVAVPKNHRLAGEKEIPLSELAREDFILLERKVSPIIADYVLDQCFQHGFSPNTAAYVRDAETALLMAASGKGVTFLNSGTAIPPVPNLATLNVAISDADGDLDLVAAYRPDNLNPILPVFLRKVMDSQELGV